VISFIRAIAAFKMIFYRLRVGERGLVANSPNSTEEMLINTPSLPFLPGLAIFITLLFMLGCHHSYAEQTLQNSTRESGRPHNQRLTEVQVKSDGTGGPANVASLEPVIAKDPQPTASLAQRLADNEKLPNQSEKAKSSEPNTLDLKAQHKTAKNIELHPYTAHYNIMDGDEVIGTAVRLLSRQGNNWRLEMSTGTDRWYYKYHFVETSLFRMQEGLPVPLEYSSVTQRSFKKDKVIKSQFDWKKKQEKGQQNGKTWSLPLSEPLFDHLNYQVALQSKAANNRRQEAFRVSYKGKIETYRFVNEGKDIVKTPLGSFSTVVWYEKVEPSEDKYLVLWLAPDLNYLPVQIIRYHNGKPEGIILLKRLEMQK
jgi:hypothetical protein